MAQTGLRKRDLTPFPLLLFLFLTTVSAVLGQTEQLTVAGRNLDGWARDLASENETCRLRAAKTIGAFHAEAVPILTEMLNHADPSVRYWAASHLGDLGDASRPAVPLLQELVVREPVTVRISLAYALARITGDSKWLEVLTQAIASDERGLACSAVEFLGRIGPAARPALADLRKTLQRHDQGGDYHVRGAALNAIRQITADPTLAEYKRPQTGGGHGDLPALAKGPSRQAPGTNSDPRPNILWISCEDISPNLGCYGDPFASTPNLDRLATQGVRFTQAFTPAGVCAVVRSGIITGVYPISLGSQHMRSRIVPPPEVRCFTEYLRAAGYFCTNKSKTDYQFESPITAWDRQGNNHSDWRDRPPGQPFFAVINLTISHESQIRHSAQMHAELLEFLQPSQRHDPDKAGPFLPPIYPDTPEARKDWAWYHDNISEMDRQAGVILQHLEEDGLAGDTIVIFWSDHGRGLPRAKRWIYDSGVHIPMIVRWPGPIEPGSVRDDMVSTQDLAPTMLALAGLDPKPYMQGRVFLGSQTPPSPEYLFFHRDRMDEAYEMMRGARDHHFKYIRNYEPDKPYAQHIDYMDQMPTMVDLRRLHALGKLNKTQEAFFQPTKPIEELYDVVSDPDETVNIAGQPGYAKILAKMRKAVELWQDQVGDLGLVPEPILMERMRPGAEYQTTLAPHLVCDAGPDRDVTRSFQVSLSCPTPGASIAYADADRPPGQWRLYSKPFQVPAGTRLRLKACRLGFLDSEVVQVTVKDRDEN